MFIIKTKKEYKFTKKLLTEFILIVREIRKSDSIEKVNFLSSGYISQIKEFIQQLRLYRKKVSKRK